MHMQQLGILSSPRSPLRLAWTLLQCLCPPVEAVLTPCGHIHCWKCLYQWMDSGQPGANECPVCRSGISRANVIPIYGRGGGGGSRRRQASAAASSAEHDGHAGRGAGVGQEGAAASAPASAAAAAGAGSAAAADSPAASSASSSSGIAPRRSAPYSWAPSAGGSASSSSSSSFSSSSIPRRPAAQRVDPPPRGGGAAGGGGGGWGGLHFAPLFGGGVIYAGGGAFSVGFGLIPALLGLLFQNAARGDQQHAPPGQPGQPGHGQPAAQSTAFGNAMLLLGIFFILMLIYS